MGIWNIIRKLFGVKKKKRVSEKRRICNVCGKKRQTSVRSPDYVCKFCRPNKPKRRK